MLIKCTYDSKSRTLPISHRNGWSFRVYMIPLRDFVTGVNSRRGDTRRHDFLWWYHVNKCRAMRGNRSELVAARKSPWCHVNTPLFDLGVWIESTVKPPVNNHPKCEDFLMTYGRWSFTRIADHRDSIWLSGTSSNF